MRECHSEPEARQGSTRPQHELHVLLPSPTQVSQPYVDMTVKLMENFGVTVEKLNGLQHMRVGGFGRTLSCHVQP